MDLEPVEGTRPFTVGLTALALFLVLLVLARLFLLTCGLISRALSRFTLPRVSYLMGIVAAAVVFWSLVDGLFFAMCCARCTPALRWIPIVTMLQVAADMLAGDITPAGHGHNYAPEDYIDAWVALTEPVGWRAVDTQRLKSRFDE